jgi:hypothetical protein
VRRLAWLAGLLAAACGGPTAPSQPSPTPAPPRAAIVVSLEPGSVVASSDPSRPWLARWTLVVTETGGSVGGSINAVNVSLRDPSSGAKGGSGGFTGEEVAKAAGTNQVAAGGSLRIPESAAFVLPSGGRRVLVNAAVQLLDDSGSFVSGTASGVVQ